MTRLPTPETLQLSNGIPVIFYPTDGTVAATYWWIRTGSCDERGPEAGFAHFLEHMLFKDAAAKETGKASTGKMARAIESLGGDVNAYTSFDQTVYHVTCAAHHWEKVFEAWGTIGKPQRFLKKDFDSEREVILEELKKNEDAPGRQLFQNLFQSLFAKHPYGRPVIGFTKTLKAAKVGDLERFYQRNYVSGQMGLILVGPYDEARKASLLKIAEKRFGSKVLGRKAVVRPARPVEAEMRSGSHVIVKEFDVKTPSLAMAFRVPELRHADIAALDLAAGILGMGELSRIYQRLFYRESLATEASAGLYVPADPGMFYLSIDVPKTEQLAKATSIAFEEFARLRDEGPTSEEIERVLTNLESERLYATQTADGIAGRVGFLRFVMGDLSFDREYLDQLRSVDAAKIREVCARYFDPRRMGGSVLVPKGQRSALDLKAIEAAAHRILGGHKGSTSAEGAKASTKKGRGKPKGASRPDLEPRPEVVKRASGMTVIYRERPMSSVVSVQAAVLGGLRLELTDPVTSAAHDWGASNLLATTWNKGCGHGLGVKDSRQIAAIVEGSAASIEGFSGRNTIGVQMTSLARDWKKLSPLFGEVLIEPTFPAEEVEHSKRVIEDTIRGVEDHSSQLCTKLFLETLFESHPYGKLTQGSLESLHGLQAERLLKFHQRWVQASRLVVSVVGAVKRAEVEEWLESLESRLERKGAVKAHEAPRIRPESPLVAPRWVERKLGREQVHLIAGGLGSTLASEDRFALRLLSNILGGQSGRLFIELREKRSLAYTVAPVSFEGMEPGYIGTYIACSPSKKEEALVGMQRVLDQLAAKGPTAQEMERAREYYLGRRAMDLQGDGSLASYYCLESIYGLPLLSQAEVLEKVSAVTPKDIQRLCQKYLVDSPKVTAVVG